MIAWSSAESQRYEIGARSGVAAHARPLLLETRLLGKLDAVTGTDTPSHKAIANLWNWRDGTTYAASVSICEGADPEVYHEVPQGMGA